MDSNQGPSACKADALNQLSYAPFLEVQKYFFFLIQQVVWIIIYDRPH